MKSIVFGDFTAAAANIIGAAEANSPCRKTVSEDLSSSMCANAATCFDLAYSPNKSFISIVSMSVQS